MMQKQVGTMTLSTPSDREIHMTRVFNARAAHVYQAFTVPALLQRWLGVHNGWTMPVCEVDLKVGGKYRYEWRGRDGMKMGMGGTFREIVPNQRLVATEKFDESWYPGEAIDTTTFVESAGKTTVVMAVLYDNKEARDAVLKTPMEQGVAAGFDALASLLMVSPSEAVTARLSQTGVSAPQIVHTQAQHTAAIKLDIPVAQVRDVMGPGITEVFEAIGKQGMTPAGAWVNHHFKMPSTTFDFEIAVPVDRPIKPVGRVIASSWPAMKVVRAVYQGPYEGLPEAWGAFIAWIAESGLKTSNELWEQYVEGPQTHSDPKLFRTELNKPLID